MTPTLMMSLLTGCGGLEPVELLVLQRQDAAFHASLETARNCNGSVMDSHLDGVRASTAWAIRDGLGLSEGSGCQGVGATWDDVSFLADEERMWLELTPSPTAMDRLELGNFPTAPRALIPESDIAQAVTTGATLRFEMDGPGVIDPDGQVSLETVGAYLLIPQDGGAVFWEDNALEITFPAGLGTPTELRVDGIWDITFPAATEATLGYAVENHPDNGAVFRL